MRFGEGLLDEIRQRTDLVALVSRRVKLLRKGQLMWGCCPFHAEKSPSFKVDNVRRLYKCFGCGKGGDAFRWLMETEGLNFPEAVERLAEQAGMELPKWSAQDDLREQRRKTLYEILELAAKFYEDKLADPAGRQGREYLQARGIDAAVAKQFRLGYAPSGRTELIDHLRARKVEVDDIIAAGLALGPQQSGADLPPRALRDFFFNRVMFPITDRAGRIIAFGARTIQDGVKPKYINTGETALFSKGAQLYNFAFARTQAVKAGTIIVAEGYMDVIALVRAGMAHSVAPLGTALTEEQLLLLWRAAAEPILAFDGDVAGFKAAQRAAHLALPHLRAGYSLRFAFLPAGEDPDSFIAAYGKASMCHLLDSAVPLSQLLWRIESEGKDFSTPERRAGLEQSLKALAARIKDATVAQYYRRNFQERIAEKFRPMPGATAFGATARDGWAGIGPKFPGAGLVRSRPGAQQAVSMPAKLKASALVQSGGRHAKEMELGRLLLDCPNIALLEAESLAVLELQDPWLDRLRHELLNLAASGSSLEKPGVQTHLTRQGMADLLARFAGSPVDDPHASFQRAISDLRELAGHRADARQLLERRKALSDRQSGGSGKY